MALSKIIYKYTFYNVWSVIFASALLAIIFSVDVALCQTATPTITALPRLEKLPRAKPEPNLEPVDMHESSDYSIRKMKKLKAEGKLKVFSSPKIEADLKHPLPSVTNFKITALNGAACLTWDAVPGAKTYNIYISENGRNFRRRINKSQQGTSIVVRNLVNGKKYYFAVAPARILEGARVIRKVIPIKPTLDAK